MRTVRLTKESTKDILENLLKRSPNNYGKFEAAVADILANVKEKGDEALFSYTKEFDKVEAIICSMTKQEKRNTKLLNGSRRQRIAKGSGTTVQDVNKFMKSFEMTQKMMKQLKSNKGGMRKMMKNMNLDDIKDFKM